MLILGFAIVGMLGIVLAAIAVGSNKRRAASGAATPHWLIARRWSGPLGLLLGIGSYFISYPLQDQGETWRVMGFPFFAAAFDPRGADYVGIATIPAIIGNFVFFLALPQLILWATGRSRVRGA
jgi:hypothetical protein